MMLLRLTRAFPPRSITVLELTRKPRSPAALQSYYAAAAIRMASDVANSSSGPAQMRKK